MYQSFAQISTAEGFSYIRKLCRHFAHKIPVSYTETEGKAELPGAVCMMHAGPDKLEFTINGDNKEEVLKGEDIIVRHLVKFAFREELVINWERNELFTV